MSRLRPILKEAEAVTSVPFSRGDRIAVLVNRSLRCAYGPADGAPAWRTITAIGTKKSGSLNKYRSLASGHFGRQLASGAADP
jgi:hypothetical protein